MYQSVGAIPGPSQVFKDNIFARIIEVFKITLLIILVKSTIVDCLKSSDYTFFF